MSGIGGSFKSPGTRADRGGWGRDDKHGDKHGGKAAAQQASPAMSRSTRATPESAPAMPHVPEAATQAPLAATPPGTPQRTSRTDPPICADDPDDAPRQPARSPRLESLQRTLAWLGNVVGLGSAVAFAAGLAWLVEAGRDVDPAEAPQAKALLTLVAVSTLVSAADALYACREALGHAEETSPLGPGSGLVAHSVYRGLRACGGMQPAEAARSARLEGLLNPALALATLLTFLVAQDPATSLDPQDPGAAGWPALGHVGASVGVGLARAVQAAVEYRISDLSRRARDRATVTELVAPVDPAQAGADPDPAVPAATPRDSPAPSLPETRDPPSRLPPMPPNHVSLGGSEDVSPGYPDGDTPSSPEEDPDWLLPV